MLGSLNYEVVQVLPLGKGEKLSYETLGGESHPWEKIQTQNGIIGYVYGKFLRSALDFRAFFAYQNGKWILSSFVSGD